MTDIISQNYKTIWKIIRDTETFDNAKPFMDKEVYRGQYKTMTIGLVIGGVKTYLRARAHNNDHIYHTIISTDDFVVYTHVVDTTVIKERVYIRTTEEQADQTMLLLVMGAT